MLCVLTLLEDALKKNRDQLLDALSADLGKPVVEAYLAEYYFVLQELRMVKRSLKSWMKPKKVGSPIYFQPISSAVERVGYGVALIYSPWNYPIQ